MYEGVVHIYTGGFKVDRCAIEKRVRYMYMK